MASPPKHMGTILAPSMLLSLSLPFNNDLPNTIHRSLVDIYTDDHKLYGSAARNLDLSLAVDLSVQLACITQYHQSKAHNDVSREIECLRPYLAEISSQSLDR